MRQCPLVARPARSITDPVAMVRELELVRRRGYAVDNEENRQGVKCIGVGIVDYRGVTVAAMSVAVPAYRLPDRAIPALAAKIRDGAAGPASEAGAPIPVLTHPTAKRDPPGGWATPPPHG